MYSKMKLQNNLKLKKTILNQYVILNQNVLQIKRTFLQMYNIFICFFIIKRLKQARSLVVSSMR